MIGGLRGVWGRMKGGARQERRHRRRVTGRRSLRAVREAGDQEAGELARDGRVTAVSGGVVERFAAVRRAGLTHANVVKPAYSLWPQGGCRGVAPPPLRSPSI